MCPRGLLCVCAEYRCAAKMIPNHTDIVVFDEIAGSSREKYIRPGKSAASKSMKDGEC